MIVAHAYWRTRDAPRGSFSRIRRLGIVLALLLAAPAQGAVVARDGDLVLRAKRKGSKVCLSVRGLSATGARCQPAPVSPFRPAFLDPFSGDAPIAAAVPDRVRAVEIDGRRVDTGTAPGLPWRFFILADADSTSLLRFFDADGTLIAAARSDYGLPIRGRRGTLVLRRAGVRIRAARDYQLRPDPLRVDHTVPSICYSFASKGGGFGTCRSAGGLPPLDVEVERPCAPDVPVLRGVVDSDVRTVELTLGSGRRLRVPTFAAPASVGGSLRFLAQRLPRDEAVRTARGLDADGRVRGRATVRSAPGGQPCPDGTLVSSGTTGYGLIFRGRPRAEGRGAAVAGAGGHRLFAGDGRAFATVCAAFDQRRSGCAPAPVDSEYFALDRAGDAIGGVLAGDVATVRLVLDRGAPVVAPTTAGAAYDGRFEGRLRFLAAAVPPGRTVEHAVALDAEGRRLGRGFVTSTFTRETVARIPPVFRVRRYGGGVEGRRYTQFCLTPPVPDGGLFSASACRLRGQAPIVVTASCDPRRMLVYGYLPRGVRGLDVVRSDGVRVPARVQRLPARAGGGRVFTHALARDLGVRAVVYSDRPPKPFRFDPRPPRRVVLRLPPATEQCGYDEAPDPD